MILFIYCWIVILYKVLELQPENAKALFRRGVANMNLNNMDRAENDLKKAETLDPEGMSVVFMSYFTGTIISGAHEPPKVKKKECLTRLHLLCKL